MKKVILPFIAIVMIVSLTKIENARFFIRKIIYSLLVLFISTSVYAQSSGSSTSAATTYAFETAINGLWQYNSSANVYYIVGINYCASPANTTYEQMGIFVPGAYMNATSNGDGTYTCTINPTATVNGYTASEAPIVVPVNTPGYSAQSAPTAYSSSVATYTNVGFIYLWPGCRGNTQGAPLGVTDLKAAVRYFRYLKAIQNAVPGNTNRIFSFGMSGGGAQSAILGASGNSSLYNAYLTAIGAESGYTDNICGSMCWCPVTNLDQGNEAHEWNMGLTRSSLSTSDASISKGLAANFATYINAIGLKNPTTGATLTLSSTANGYYQNGSYYEYVMGVINNSISRYNSYNGASVSLYSTTDTMALFSFASSNKIATKGMAAYDNYAAKTTPENKLFGIAGTTGHFDQYLAPLINTYAPNYSSAFTSDLASTNIDAVGKTVQERLMMYTPLYYLVDNSTYYNGGGFGSSNVAPYWRIRSGIKQSDAPLSTEINLALALQNYSGVMGVDFETIWGQAHVQAEDNGTATANFITWVGSCVAAMTGVNGIKNSDEEVKAYSLGKVIYIRGKLTGYTASIISINGTPVGSYKLTNEGLTTLDERNLIDGVYILRLNKGSKLYTFKLILQR